MQFIKVVAFFANNKLTIIEVRNGFMPHVVRCTKTHNNDGPNLERAIHLFIGCLMMGDSTCCCQTFKNGAFFCGGTHV